MAFIIDKFIETESWIAVSRDWGKEKMNCSKSIDEKLLEIHCITVGIWLILLSCALKNGYDAKFYVMFLTTILKNK